MPNYYKNTGIAGEMIMKISPNLREAEFQLRVKVAYPGQQVLVPWAYTLDGQTYWNQTLFSLSTTNPYTFGLIAITKTGTVGFQIGNTDTVELGGPSGIYQLIDLEEPEPEPGPGPTPNTPTGIGRVKIRSGAYQVDALPWVRIDGVWKQAIPWIKFEGRWQKMF